MKRGLLTLSAVCLTASLCIAQTRPPSATDEKTKAEIMRLEDSLTKAWLKNDVRTISSIVADDFQYWSFKGERRTKADMLRAVAKSEEGDTKVEDRQVRIYGNAAIYTARIVDTGKHPDGTTFTARTCITTVFVRRDGKWLMVADHETLIPN